jgi:hypothetical protein
MASVDLNNTTLRDINSKKDSLVNEVQTNYNNQVNLTDQKYNELINASKDYAKQQSNIQQQQTNQTIKEINQNKEKAEKDYTKEQKGAYADYAKQTNDYGVNAERQAAAGLQGSGYSESSKVNMYNTYQNRYVAARDSYNLAIQNYDNQIAQARIQNSSALAEIAYNALQTQLQTAIEGFQYKNELLNNLTSQKINISSTYDNMWQSQYQTLLNEAQYNEDMAYQKQRDSVADSQWQKEFELNQSQWQKEFALSQAQFEFQKAQASKSSKSSGGGTLKNSSKKGSLSSKNGNGGSLESTISDAAKTLAKNISNLTNTKSKVVNGMTSTAAKAYVYKQVQNNKITDEEADYIFRKAGL